MFNEELVPVVKTLVIVFTQDLVTLIARIKKRRKLLIKDRSRSGYVLVKIGSAVGPASFVGRNTYSLQLRVRGEGGLVEISRSKMCSFHVSLIMNRVKRLGNAQ